MEEQIKLRLFQILKDLNIKLTEDALDLLVMYVKFNLDTLVKMQYNFPFMEQQFTGLMDDINKRIAKSVKLEEAYTDFLIAVYLRAMNINIEKLHHDANNFKRGDSQVDQQHQQIEQLEKQFDDLFIKK